MTDNRFMEIIFFTDFEGIEDLIGIPVACSPVESESIFNDFMEGSTCLFNGGVGVKPMGIEDVDIVKL